MIVVKTYIILYLNIKYARIHTVPAVNENMGRKMILMSKSGYWEQTNPKIPMIAPDYDKKNEDLSLSIKLTL